MLNQQVADSSTERAQIQLKIPPFRPSRCLAGEKKIRAKTREFVASRNSPLVPKLVWSDEDQVFCNEFER